MDEKHYLCTKCGYITTTDPVNLHRCPCCFRYNTAKDLFVETSKEKNDSKRVIY